MTLTPLNPVHTVYSASATSSAHPTYQYIAGIVNSPTAPFITATSPCRISLTMTPQNPPALPFTEDPLPPLSSIRLLKSSPQCSQGSLPLVPDNLDSLLPLPLLQYPQDLPPPPTISLPLDKCLPAQSTAPSQATTSQLTPTEPSSTGSLSPQRHGLTASPKTSLLKKWITRRSWMTTTRPLSSWRPASLGISKPSPNPPTGTLKTVVSRRSLSPAAMGSLTQQNGFGNSMMVGSPDTQLRMALMTYPMSAKSMRPPSIWLTLQSLYPIGSMKPFKGRPLDTLPSLMQSRLRTIGGSKLTLCTLGPSMSGLLPTRLSSTALTGSSKAPSSPETNAEDGWNARDFPSGFHIWQENRHACLQIDKPAGDGRRDEDVTSKRGCDVIDLTNEDSSSDDEEL